MESNGIQWVLMTSAQSPRQPMNSALCTLWPCSFSCYALKMLLAWAVIWLDLQAAIKPQLGYSIKHPCLSFKTSLRMLLIMRSYAYHIRGRASPLFEPRFCKAKCGFTSFEENTHFAGAAFYPFSACEILRYYAFAA